MIHIDVNLLFLIFFPFFEQIIYRKIIEVKGNGNKGK